ncbi:Protein of unknown function [Gryllus bimaculatus]|nr:Protein of unknown function [Gryllus bimaculatus]
MGEEGERGTNEILQVLSNLAKTSVLRVCPDKIFFVIMESQQPQAWWELDPEQFFSEFTMRGVSDVYNEFYLEFATGEH